MQYRVDNNTATATASTATATAAATATATATTATATTTYNNDNNNNNNNNNKKNIYKKMIIVKGISTWMKLNSCYTIWSDASPYRLLAK